MPRHRKKIIDIASAIVLLGLIALDMAMWRNIFTFASTSGSAAAARIYFLPVTQGESALLVLPDGVTILTDAGSDGSIVDDLQKALPSDGAPAYIDLAIISSSQSADYGGYQYLLQHYDVGAFLYNGRADDVHSAQWEQLMDSIAAKHIPLITVGAGDGIRYDGVGASAAEMDIEILSPDADFARSPDPSDAGIVERVVTPHFAALLAADIGTNVESVLLARAANASGANASASTSSGTADLRADILKAPFPGLGTRAGDAFLRAVAPRVIVVEPGVKNTASAPTKQMLAHLASSTSATIVSPKAGQFLLYNK
jgi:competence protein ComEC